jgi:hypothetical protein
MHRNGETANQDDVVDEEAGDVEAGTSFQLPDGRWRTFSSQPADSAQEQTLEQDKS